MSLAPPFPIPTGPGVRIIASHPAGLLALEKPGGALSHPNSAAPARNALLVAAYDADAECYHFTDTAGATRRVWLLNRLDSPTSGVVLLALNADAAEAVKKAFAGHDVGKTYHAVVKGGRPTPPEGRWRDRLDKRRGAGHVRSEAGAGVESVSRYAWLRTNRELPALSLLRLEPETGRTHQLRVQCAEHGHPVAGDKTYGDFALNRTLAARDNRFDRLFLHCSRTAFRIVIAGRAADFVAESPLPPEFEKLVAASDVTPVSERLAIRVNRPKSR